MSHSRSHAVTDAGRPSGVTVGVTLLQTRPDQTRVFSLAVVCCVVAQRGLVKAVDVRGQANQPAGVPS